MEKLELDDDPLDKTMFCPNCQLPLYPRDENFKFFLFICRACGHKDQLDYSFTWEARTISNTTILPSVKQQRGATCAPTVMVTALEARLRFSLAAQGKYFDEKLCIEDLVKQYEEEMGPGFSWDDLRGADKHLSRDRICINLLEQNGVTSKAYGQKKSKQERYKAKSSETRASFSESCKMILRGHFFYISIPITEEFDNLKANDIYIADRSRVKKDPDGGEFHHAVMLVGFGRKNKVNYFRFMNSHGTKFCDKGFGNVRADEIKKFISFEPLYN